MTSFAPMMASYKEGGVLVIIYTIYLRISEAHECRPGYYGAKCDRTCGHCIGGHAYCDVFDGFCANGCSSGYMGATCLIACPPTLYGPSCRKECPPNCKDLGCDPVSGECSSNGCKSGFQGAFCNQECPENTYGPGCVHTCQCPLCGCHPVTGSCYRQCQHKRAAPVDEQTGNKQYMFIHEAFTHKKQTRLVCQELEAAFSDIIRIVNATQPIPLWPIAVLLILIIIGLILTWKKHMEQLQELEGCQDKWEETFLQQSVVGDVEKVEDNIKAQENKLRNEAEEKSLRSETVESSQAT